jgi:hypothetical protein
MREIFHPQKEAVANSYEPIFTNMSATATVCARSRSRLSVKLVAELSEVEVDECVGLTLKRGLMRYSLQHLRFAMNPGVRDRRRLRALKTAHVVLLRNPKGVLIAWALIKYGNSNHTKEMSAYLFVGVRSRRRGHGSRLVAEIRRRWPNAEFCPHDAASYSFFRQHEPLPYNSYFVAAFAAKHDRKHVATPAVRSRDSVLAA